MKELLFYQHAPSEHTHEHPPRSIFLTRTPQGGLKGPPDAAAAGHLAVPEQQHEVPEAEVRKQYGA
jgi:hypothetical protein